MRAEISSEQVQIFNTCTDPPRGLEWQVRRSLRWIQGSDLDGLGYVQIADELPEVEGSEDVADWAKRARNDGTHGFIYGWYSSVSADAPAHIILYFRQIYRGIPRALWWSTLPTLRIVSSLAHEIGHHLVATKGYVIQPGEMIDDEELLVDQYAAKVLQEMATHWSYKVGLWGLKELATWHYVFGIADFRAKKYRSAADSFYKSWVLDRQNQEALDQYWRARHMSDSG